MQYAGETGAEGLARELKEELGCAVTKTEFVGVYRAVAAKQSRHGGGIAELFRVRIGGEPRAAAEIEEMMWMRVEEARGLALAPLTRDSVVPLVLG